MSEEWHYARDGQQFGPFSVEEFRRLASDRRLQPDDLVWRDDMADWKPASSVRGLFATPSQHQPSAKVVKGVGEKFCHECGAAIRLKAEICPQCGVRQPSIPDPNRSHESVEKDKRGLLTTPVLISAIGNIVVGLIWFGTLICIPVGIPMVILCIFEFMYYGDSDRLSPEELIRRAGNLAICEIVCGLFNLVSLVCGILLLINKGKYERLVAEQQERMP